MRPFFIILLTLVLPAFAARAAEDVKTEKAIFAGGCFWSMQKPFDGIPGVKEVLAGFTGGTVPNPS